MPHTLGLRVGILTLPENSQPGTTFDAVNPKHPKNLQVTLDKTWKSFIICVLLRETSRSPKAKVMYVFCIPDASAGAVSAAVPQIPLVVPRLSTLRRSDVPTLRPSNGRDRAQTRHTRHTHSPFIPSSFMHLRTASVTLGVGLCLNVPTFRPSNVQTTPGLSPLSCAPSARFFKSPYPSHSIGFTLLVFSYTYALLCHSQNAISRLFKRLRTLQTKTPEGVGVTSRLRIFQPGNLSSPLPHLPHLLPQPVGTLHKSRVTGSGITVHGSRVTSHESLLTPFRLCYACAARKSLAHAPRKSQRRDRSLLSAPPQSLPVGKTPHGETSGMSHLRIDVLGASGRRTG